MRPRLSESTEKALHELSEPGETTDDVVRRLIEEDPDVRRARDRVEREDRQEAREHRRQEERRREIESLCDDCLRRLQRFDETRETSQRERIGKEIDGCCGRPHTRKPWTVEEKAELAGEVLEERRRRRREQAREQERSFFDRLLGRGPR